MVLCTNLVEMNGLPYARGICISIPLLRQELCLLDLSESFVTQCFLDMIGSQQIIVEERKEKGREGGREEEKVSPPDLYFF